MNTIVLKENSLTMVANKEDTYPYKNTHGPYSLINTHKYQRKFQNNCLMLDMFSRNLLIMVNRQHLFKNRETDIR